jgi:ketosteroid isomerase-like protein
LKSGELKLRSTNAKWVEPYTNGDFDGVAALSSDAATAFTRPFKWRPAISAFWIPDVSGGGPAF